MKKLKYSEWFIFMPFMGAFVGGFGVMCQYMSPHQELKDMNPFITFVAGFGPVMIFALLIYLGMRKKHKDGIPIR